ncbi:hypothetical protein JCM10207_002450 [Rhodosporidiobolus poonsookiae]
MADADSGSPLATQEQATGLILPPVLGWQAATFLYGIYCILHVQYVTSPLYKRILWPVKVALWVVFVLLLAYEVIINYEHAMWTVTQDRTLEHLRAGWEFESYPPLLSGLVAAPVQTILMLRTASLLRRSSVRWAFICWTSTLILLTLTASILVCATNIMSFHGEYLMSFNNALAMKLWASAGTDVTISVALALTLKQRVAGFSEKTDSLLHKLIQSALQTAAYTAIIAIAGATVSVAYKDSNTRYAYINYAFWAPLPACYGISLYTTLSTRRTVEEYIGSSLPLPGSAQANIPSTGGLRPGGYGYGVEQSGRATPTPRSAVREVALSVGRGNAFEPSLKTASSGKGSPEELRLDREKEEV